MGSVAGVSTGVALAGNCGKLSAALGAETASSATSGEETTGSAGVGDGDGSCGACATSVADLFMKKTSLCENDLEGATAVAKPADASE
jgi:hypothetical protein